MLFSLPMIAMLAWSAMPPGKGVAHGYMTRVSVDDNARINRQFIEQAISPRPNILYQVRIEQRIRIRIPRRNGNSRQTLASLPEQSVERPKMKARKIGKCIAMNGISGVQINASENRLMLYMRDRSIIRADLEKNCPARSFYSGFYLEQSADGQLCVERDLLLARSGQQCELDKIRKMVVDD